MTQTYTHIAGVKPGSSAASQLGIPSLSVLALSIRRTGADAIMEWHRADGLRHRTCAPRRLDRETTERPRAALKPSESGQLQYVTGGRRRDVDRQVCHTLHWRE